MANLVKSVLLITAKTVVLTNAMAALMDILCRMENVFLAK